MGRDGIRVPRCKFPVAFAEGNHKMRRVRRWQESGSGTTRCQHKGIDARQTKFVEHGRRIYSASPLGGEAEIRTGT